MGINYTVIVIVVVYLIAMLLIGWYSYTKISSNEDFMVAGRRLGPVLMAGTLAATEIGGGSSLGVVEKAYGDWGMGASWYIITMAITRPSRQPAPTGKPAKRRSKHGLLDLYVLLHSADPHYHDYSRQFHASW